ncbi:hypothetical protein IGI04_016356 [Brassica rapa subsp. trilocularis]|uniref:Secreted protein n=1 Tax=Brassica rapa subsp. trilocularis TaxID=1813537 RepID=A0ABQ7MSS5_BRACM|nr:hypothetical protein IGI04_016356 [Brassica rapa subsp. trilocularis]
MFVSGCQRLCDAQLLFVSLSHVFATKRSDLRLELYNNKNNDATTNRTTIVLFVWSTQPPAAASALMFSGNACSFH